MRIKNPEFHLWTLAERRAHINVCLITRARIIPSLVNDFSWVDESCCSDRIVHTDRSGTFINTERRAPEEGRSWTRTDIDPVPSLCECCVYPSPSSLSSIAKAPGGKMCVNWLWRAHAEYYLWRHWTSSKTSHSSLRCLCYQFSIMVKLKLSRFPLKHFASLVMWLDHLSVQGTTIWFLLQLFET